MVIVCVYFYDRDFFYRSVIPGGYHVQILTHYLSTYYCMGQSHKYTERYIIVNLYYGFRIETSPLFTIWYRFTDKRCVWRDEYMWTSSTDVWLAPSVTYCTSHLKFLDGLDSLLPSTLFSTSWNVDTSL